MPTLTIKGLSKAGQADALRIAKQHNADGLIIPGTETRGTYRVRLAANYGNTPDNLAAAQKYRQIAAAWRAEGLGGGQYGEIILHP